MESTAAARESISPGRSFSACASATSRRHGSGTASCAAFISTSAPPEVMGALGLLHLTAGAILALVAWLMPRPGACARRTPAWVLLLDMAPFALGAGLLGLASGRPLFTGLVALALGAGFTLTDYTMRQTLREPVVFSAASELPQVFTHPHLYLPFAGPGLVVGGAMGAVAAGLALLVVEPPLWTPHPVVAFLALMLMAACTWLLAREP